MSHWWKSLPDGARRVLGCEGVVGMSHWWKSLPDGARCVLVGLAMVPLLPVWLPLFIAYGVGYLTLEIIKILKEEK